MTIHDATQSINKIIATIFSSASALFPRIFWALILAGTGWVVALILKKITIKTASGFDKLFQKQVEQQGLPHVQIKRQFGFFLGEAVFWLSFLFFLVLAINILQLEFLSTFLQNVLNSLPLLAIGIVIIFASFFIGSISRQIVKSTFLAMHVEQAELLGNAVKAVIVFMGLLLGIAQIGIDISFLTTVVSISFGAALGALALAFGIGAMTFVENILSTAHIRRIYQDGDTIVLENFKGKIIEITSTMVILQSDEGQSSMPAKLFLEKTSLLLTPLEKDEA